MKAAAPLIAVIALAACTAPPASMQVEDPVVAAVLADMRVPCVAIDFAAPDRGALQRFLPGMQFSSEGNDLSPEMSYRVEAAASAATHGDTPPPVQAKAPFADRAQCAYDALGSGDQVARLTRPAIANGIAFVEVHGAGQVGWYVLDDSSGSWTIIAKASNYAI